MYFKNQASLLRSRRKAAELSQGDLAQYLGYTTAQLISNIERGVSGIPLKSLPLVIKKLKISRKQLSEALINDYSLYLAEILRDKK